VIASTGQLPPNLHKVRFDSMDAQRNHDGICCYHWKTALQASIVARGALFETVPVDGLEIKQSVEWVPRLQLRLTPSISTLGASRRGLAREPLTCINGGVGRIGTGQTFGGMGQPCCGAGIAAQQTCDPGLTCSSVPMMGNLCSSDGVDGGGVADGGTD
jgi:hypothetical protein